MPNERPIYHIFFKTKREIQAQEVISKLDKKRAKNPSGVLKQREYDDYAVNKDLVDTATRRQFLAWTISAAGIAVGAALGVEIFRLTKPDESAEFDDSDYYPEIGRKPVSEDQFTTKTGKKVEIYNFSGVQVDYEAAKDVFNFYESLALLGLSGKLEKQTSGTSVAYKSGLSPSNQAKMYIIGEGDPDPKWAHDNYSGSLTDAFHNGSSLNLSLITVKEEKSNSGVPATKEDLANLRMFVEIAQNSFGFVANTNKDAYTAQDVYANSYSAALVLRQQKTSFEEYKKIVSSTHDVSGYSLIDLPEDNYNALPIFPRLVKSK